MRNQSFNSRSIGSALAALVVLSALPAEVHAQLGRRGGPPPAFIEEGYDDHQNMMDQLGIKALRPGKSGGNQNGKGFDEATANEWLSTLPDLLTMKDGTKVTTPALWETRRAEIAEDFEREVFGRIPANVPKVTWEVTNTTEGTSGDIPTVTKTLVGHVDNSAFPEVTVNVQASFTVPANAKSPVPIIIEFGGGGGGGFGGARRGARGPAAGGPAAAAAGAAGPGAAGQGESGIQTAGGQAAADKGAASQATGPGARGPGRGGRGPGGGAPPWTQQAIAHGWGYGYLSPGSIQADGGSFQLRQGIIGLTNKGKPRKPDDWGALRAWQWGTSRLIDYFEANPDSNVDPKKVGIEGVSRYGKAALVTGAFEPRIAVAFVASSGAGGAKLHRRDFGEAVENLTGGEYYWFAGNFMKYGAFDATFGEKNASHVPVDSHQLIAMCAPRLCFVSYGVEPGDPKWVDAHGSFMAAILAGPAYKLLGKKDLGVTGDYLTAPMPPVDQLVGGELAWRQHSGGHTSVPNFPAFFDWVKNYIPSQPPAAPPPASPNTN